MGAQLTYGALATGGGLSLWTMLQHTYLEQLHEPRWSMQQRSPKTRKDPNQWTSPWSFGCRTSMGGTGGGTDGDPAILRGYDLYEPYSCDGDGSLSAKWILGRCVDASDVAINAATVRCYVTSTDVIQGTAITDAAGNYSVPTYTPTVDHYVVAYKVGSPPTVGTTVNTLTPTNLDGT